VGVIGFALAVNASVVFTVVTFALAAAVRKFVTSSDPSPVAKS
jgi:hypothetical protein